MNPQLVEYIRNARRQGVSDIGITDELLQQGWDIHTINGALSYKPKSFRFPLIIGVVLFVLAVSSAFVLVLGMRSTDNQNVETVSPTPRVKALLSATPRVTPTNAFAPTATPSPIATQSSFLDGYKDISKGTTIALNQYVTLDIFGATIASAEAINKGKGEGMQGDIIHEGNIGVIVYYRLKNTSTEKQDAINLNTLQTLQGKNEPLPLQIVLKTGRRIDIDNDMYAYYYLGLSQVPPSADIQSGFIFELPGRYNDLKNLYFLLTYPTFNPAKARFALGDFEMKQ